MGSILFAVIFIHHGSIFCVFFPDVREIILSYQRIIGIRILYFESAGASVGSSIR